MKIMPWWNIFFEKDFNIQVKIECEVVARVSDTNRRKLVENILIINNVGNFNINKIRNKQGSRQGVT